jgi:hypothetical protein
VQVDSLALQMRPRAPHEAADLGIRLCQANAGMVYRCYLAVALPIIAIGLSLFEFGPWWPTIFIWWAKPWMDRTVLFVLGRAAFGQRTTLGDLWREQRAVWWRQFILTWTWRRLSPWRSFTQAVYQLEGHSFSALRRRVVQLRNRYSSPAYFMTFSFSWAETCLSVAFISLVFWFAPADQGFEIGNFFSDESNAVAEFIGAVGYACAVLFLEPFYVAAGFGMYLNRRAELEAWDIEQEFRRAFAT